MLTKGVGELSTPSATTRHRPHPTMEAMGPIERPTIGRPAPEVSLPDSTGKRWSLSEHRGRPVVLIFHRHIA